jgi:predicted  nucleic acid-binding Zn-ribbon protein
MKVSMRFKNDEQEEEIKKLREEVKTFKERNLELQEKLSKLEKGRNMEKGLMEERENLRREKEEMEASYKAEKTR